MERQIWLELRSLPRRLVSAHFRPNATYAAVIRYVRFTSAPADRNAEGFRTPAPCTTVGRAAGGRRSKASQGGNRGEEGRCLVGRGLWGFLDRQQIACVGAQPDGAQL
jgi:hypothetical protein